MHKTADQSATKTAPQTDAGGLVVAHRSSADFRPRPGRGDVEEWDLGLDAATGGRASANINRSIMPFAQETGWHWHNLDFHALYVIRGWLTFRFAGVDDPVTVEAGDFIHQPPGVPHNVVDRSDDLEVLEITLPGTYGTFEVERPG
jgi:quercetin dioxygenase-like cupin family protein